MFTEVEVLYNGFLLFTKCSQIFSTQHLTWLIIGVILQLEQRKGNKKKEKVPNPQGSGTQHIGFLRQCLNIFYECLLKGDMTYDVT